MTPEQLQQFRDRLEQCRQPKGRWTESPFPRGWNEALAFVEKTLNEILGAGAPRA